MWRRVQILLLLVFAVSICNSDIQQAQAQVRRAPARRAQARKVHNPYKLYDPNHAVAFHGKPVDLGLSVMWSDMNVGASTPMSDGGLFAWGSTTGLVTRPFDFDSYPMEPISGNPKYDVAASLGGGWRMPLKKEVIELLTKCKISFRSNGEMFAIVLTGPSGNSIAIPCEGKLPRGGDCREHYGVDAYFWIGELNNDDMGWSGATGTFRLGRTDKREYAPYCYIESTAGINARGIRDFHIYVEDKRVGFSIRPVMDYSSRPPVTASRRTTPPRGGHDTATGRTANGNKPSGVGRTSRPSRTDGKKAGDKSPYGGKTQANGTASTSVPASTPKPAADLTSTHNPSTPPIPTPRPERPSTPPIPTPRPERPSDPPIPTPKPEHDSVHVKRVFRDARAVNLGLSVFWADRYVGARSKTEQGKMFPWVVDTARKEWGKRWRMPTKAECEELETKCMWETVTVDGQQVFKVTGRNGNYILMAHTGMRCSEAGDTIGNDRMYIWSAEADETFTDDAYCLAADDYTAVGGHLLLYMTNKRKYVQMCVRPVLER